jgi:hypothetical protein
MTISWDAAAVLGQEEVPYPATPPCSVKKGHQRILTRPYFHMLGCTGCAWGMPPLKRAALLPDQPRQRS